MRLVHHPLSPDLPPHHLRFLAMLFTSPSCVERGLVKGSRGNEFACTRVLCESERKGEGGGREREEESVRARSTGDRGGAETTREQGRYEAI